MLDRLYGMELEPAIWRANVWKLENSDIKKKIKLLDEDSLDK